MPAGVTSASMFFMCQGDCPSPTALRLLSKQQDQAFVLVILNALFDCPRLDQPQLQPPYYYISPARATSRPEHGAMTTTCTHRHTGTGTQAHTQTTITGRRRPPTRHSCNPHSGCTTRTTGSCGHRTTNTAVPAHIRQNVFCVQLLSCKTSGNLAPLQFLHECVLWCG